MPNKMFKFIKTISFLSFLFVLTKYSFAGITPPVTTCELDPSNPNGKNSWYITPVKITLSSSDLESGVKNIYYKIDNGALQTKGFSNVLNLAPNPSFETSEANPPLNTESWKLSSDDPTTTYSRDSTIYATDFQTTSIKISATDPGWHAINHSDIFAGASSYNNMSAYAWFKTENVSGSVFFNIYAITQDAQGVKTTSLIATSPVLTGTNDWSKVSLNFIASIDNVIGVYMEPGLNGTGTIWIDAVNINKSVTPTFSFYVSSDGNHTVQYYAEDKAGNIENTKSVSFKIDQTPPSNWKNSGAVRGLFGSEHEVYIWTEVDDATSGLSTFTDKFQYFTSRNPTFGRFQNLLYCNTNWVVNGWFPLVSPPFLPGVKTAYLLTPKVDLCDSNWKVCKIIRFYAEDLAGNSTTKDMCINGPWIKIRGNGIVRANGNIDMMSEAYEDNTDGLVEIGGQSISFFDSSKELYLTSVPKPTEYDYDKLYNMTTGTKTQISTTGNLVSASGVYYINGDYSLTKSKLPSNYGSATFNQIVFVNGNLTVSAEVQVATSSTALFVVKGDVKIAKSVTSIKAGFAADGTIFTAYDIEEGEECKALTLNGILSANKITFQRTLQGTQNEKDPSEYVTYEPKYITKLSDYIGVNSVKWLSTD